MRQEVLNDLFVVPDFDESKVKVAFTVADGCTAVQWAVEEGKKVVTQGKLNVHAGETAGFEAAIPDFKPWNIDTPFLYTLKLSMTIDGEPVEHTEQFGMRKIHTTRDEIYVNNKKLHSIRLYEKFQ